MKLTVELLSNVLGVEITDNDNILDEYAKMEIEDVKVVKNKVVFTVSKNAKGFENHIWGGSQMCVEIEDNDVYDVTEYKQTYSFDDLVAMEKSSGH